MSYSEWFTNKAIWGKAGHLADHKQMGVGPLGPYTTLALLEAAWPSASNPGKTAYIGATAPYTEYVSNGVTGVSGWKAVVTAYTDPLTGKIAGIVDPKDGSTINLQKSPISLNAGNLSALLFGDSLTAMNGGVGPSPGTANYATATLYSSAGYFALANVELGQPFRYVFNAGVGFNTTTMMLARIAAGEIDGKLFDVGFFLGGINNFIARGDTTPDATIADIAAIWTALKSRCSVVIAQPIWPNNGLTTAQRTAVIAVNYWIAKNARAYGVQLVTACANALVDPANATPWRLLAAYTADGTHIITASACVAGHALARALAPIKATNRMSAADGNNILLNGELRGTAGSAPTSWSAFGAVTAWTYPARSDGDPGVVFTATTTDFLTLTQTLFTGFTVGRKCIATLEYTSSDPTAAVDCLVQLSGGVIFNALKPNAPDASAFALPLTGVLSTPEFVIAAGTTYVQFFFTSSKAGTFGVARAVLQCVD